MDCSSGSYCDEEAVKLSLDTEQLLNVFPEYVWRKILKEITNPNDLQSMSNASLYFRGILAEKRTEFLFEKVLDVLSRKYSKECEEREYGFMEIPNDQTCGSCGSSRYRRPYSRILNLRLVCKYWCGVVDSFYETVFGVNCEYEVSSFGMRGYEFKEDEEDEDGEVVGKFENHFLETHGSGERNPFIGRKLELSFYRTFFSEDYYEDRGSDREFFVQRILRKYGKHVWYCEIWFDDVSSLGYSKIREWLELMPNLRNLDLQYSTYNRYFDEEMCCGFDGNLLDQEIEANGLPCFKDLKRFGSSQLPRAMFEEVLKKNSHLGIIVADDNCRVEMPMLETVKCDIVTVEDFGILEAPGVSWPMLSKLDLNFGDEEFFEWSRVFGLISRKWGGSLEYLSLVLPEAREIENQKKIVKECGSVRLELPRVKEFSLVISNFSSLDFMLPMVGIEKFNIMMKFDFGGMERKRNGVFLLVMKKQVVQFYGYHRRLVESNFWDLFPVLRKIEFRELYDKRTGKGCTNGMDSEQRVFNSWEVSRRDVVKARVGGRK